MTTQRVDDRPSTSALHDEQNSDASESHSAIITEEANDLVDPVIIIRRWGLPLAIVMLFGALAGALWAGEVLLSFESEATVLVGPVVPNADVLEGTADLARTYGEIVESGGVIDLAVQGTGVSAGDVTVAAQAGSGSATLTIRVRTPSRRATPLITDRVIVVLQEFVAGNRALVPEPVWGDIGSLDADEASAGSIRSFPIGATITVLDHGGGAVRRSLDPLQAAALGALATGLVAVAVGITIEARRRAQGEPGADAVELGPDLGVVSSPSVIADLIHHHRYQRQAIARDARARKLIQRAADHVWLLAEKARGNGGRAVVMVAVPSGAPRNVRAFWQFCDGLAKPPLVFDPSRAATQWLSRDADQKDGAPADEDRTDEALRAVVADGSPIAWIVPSRGDLDAPGDVDVGLLFISLDDEVSGWWSHARSADGVLFLGRLSDFRSATIRDRLEQLRDLDVSILGVAELSHHWLGWPSRPIEITDPVRAETEPRHVGDVMQKQGGAQ